MRTSQELDELKKDAELANLRYQANLQMHNDTLDLEREVIEKEIRVRKIGSVIEIQYPGEAWSQIMPGQSQYDLSFDNYKQLVQNERDYDEVVTAISEMSKRTDCEGKPFPDRKSEY